MEPKKRLSWKCNQCISLNHQKDNFVSYEEQQNNITMRKPFKTNVNTENSFESLPIEDDDDNFEEHSFTTPENQNALNRSCPDVNICARAKLEDMENLVKELKERLESADNEIVNLLMENCQLKIQINSYESKVNNLQTICKSTQRNPPADAVSTIAYPGRG